MPTTEALLADENGNRGNYTNQDHGDLRLKKADNRDSDNTFGRKGSKSGRSNRSARSGRSAKLAAKERDPNVLEFKDMIQHDNDEELQFRKKSNAMMDREL